LAPVKRKIWTNGYGELSTETRSGIHVQIAYGLGYSMESIKFTRAEMREAICHGAICRARRKDGWQIPKHIAGAIRRKEEAERRQADEIRRQEEAERLQLLEKVDERDATKH